jgi:GNAT superfamily N-acetyltransferase
LNVRLARADELHIVHAITLAAFAEYAGYEHPSSALDETIDQLEEAVRCGGAIVGLLDGDYVASGRFEVAPAEGWLSFERLAVLPAMRGRRFGVALIRWLEAHARSLGLTEVRASARSRAPDNRPYYLALGYEIIGYSGRYGIPDIRTHLRKRPI